MKLIDKSALVAEIKKRFDYRVNGLKAINNGTFWKEGQSEDEFNAVLTRCAYNAAKNEVFELMCFLDTLEVKEVQEEPVSKNMEESALEYANNQLIKSGVTDTNCPRELAVAQASLMVNGFKAGAKWQKEQMMKDAVEASVNTYEEIGGEGYVEFVANVPIGKYKEKDVVKIITI